MQAGGRGAGRKGEGKGKAPSGPRRTEETSSVNRDRLTYVLLSLVGRQMTVKVRGNVSYEGTLHGCDFNSDQSITLKHARKLDSPDDVAEIPNLIISGKDWLQVTGEDIPALGEPSEPSQKFAIDSEIAKSMGEIEGRELVPWTDSSLPACSGNLGAAEDLQKFDQFETARRMTGKDSEFQLENYTTKLNVNMIDEETRRKADQIAREIEAGTQHSAVEERLDREDDDGDEEAAFGASQPITKKDEPQRPQAKQAAQAAAAAGREQDAPSPFLAGDSRLAANELRGQKRGMISEMKRINALNLEPTLPKFDDVRRGFKDGQGGNRSRLPQGGADLKAEFQHSLEVIKGQEANKLKRNSAGGTTAEESSESLMKAGESGMAKTSSLNPQAKEFSMNPSAGAFTPSGSAAAASAATPTGSKPATSLVQFPVMRKNWEISRKSLEEVLEPFFQKAKDVAPPQKVEWANARGPPYNQLLGLPRAGAQQQMGPGAGACAASWQPRPQGAQSQGQGMSQMSPSSGGQSEDWRAKGMQQTQPMMQTGQGMHAGGSQPQMYQQMYVASSPGQGCGGCMAQQGQQPQPQQQTQQQPQQGPGGFAPQMMMMGCPQQGQMMMVAAPQGGGQCGMNMAPMAKFPGQQNQMMVMPGQGPQGQGQQQMMYVMMAPGQAGCFPQQGFMPQGGCMPQGDQSQGHMMQQQMYQQQRGGQG